MNKQIHRQIDWRRISAAVVAVSILFAAMFTAIHAVDNAIQLTAVEMASATAGSVGDDTGTKKSAALPGDCDMHCNQHAPVLARIPVSLHDVTADRSQVAARDDRGLYSAPQWGILEPPRA